MDDSSSLAKWSSMELMPLESSSDLDASQNESMRQRGSLQNSTKVKSNEPTISVRRVHSLHMSSSSTSPIPPQTKPPNSAAPQFMFSKPSQDLPDVEEGGR